MMSPLWCRRKEGAGPAKGTQCSLRSLFIFFNISTLSFFSRLLFLNAEERTYSLTHFISDLHLVWLHRNLSPVVHWDPWDTESNRAVMYSPFGQHLCLNLIFSSGSSCWQPPEALSPASYVMVRPVIKKSTLQPLVRSPICLVFVQHSSCCEL